MPPKDIVVHIDNSQAPDGQPYLVQFERPWATAKSNTGGSPPPARTRTRFTMPGAWVDPPPPPPPPPPSGLSMYQRIYGSGVGIDSKNNHQVGWTVGQRVSHRFRSSGGLLTHIAVARRGGPGYSGGNGGQVRGQVCLDDGAGKPAAVIGGTAAWVQPNPSSPWEDHTRQPLVAPVQLAPGTLYHIVLDNPSPTASRDYVSINDVLAFDTARHPAFTSDFAVLENRGAGWYTTNDLPVMDLTYADGSHDGNSYFAIINNLYAPLHDRQVVRQTLAPTADQSIASIAARVKKISGTGPLVATIREGGTVLAQVSLPTAPLPYSPWPDGGEQADLQGGRFLEAPATATLRAGHSYDLLLSTDAATTLCVVPIREVSGGSELGGGTWASRAYREGRGERSDDGTTWRPFYEWAPCDVQFFFGLR